MTRAASVSCTRWCRWRSWKLPARKVVEQLLANGPEALAETKALAMESSFGGMAVDDEAYARLVRMHSDRRQTAEASEGLASFAEKRAANWGGQGIVGRGSTTAADAVQAPVNLGVFPPHLLHRFDRRGVGAGRRLPLCRQRRFLPRVAGLAFGLSLDKPALLDLVRRSGGGMSMRPSRREIRDFQGIHPYA